MNVKQPNKDFLIRRMTRAELDVVMDWAAGENWNPGLRDADVFYKSYADSFFVSEYKGEMIGSVSAVAYDENFGFIGCFIIKPEFRHRGFGLELGVHALQSLQNRNAGVDGVVEQIENYQNAGFKFAYKNIRFKCVGGGRFPKEAIPLADIPFESLCEYDRKFFPADRSLFLKDWIKAPETFSVGVMKDNKLAGVGTIRKARTGLRVGPLFADNGTIAETIFKALISRFAGTEIFIDVPEVNKGAAVLVAKYQMTKVFETARMYSKSSPHIMLSGIYGVTSFELG